MILKYNNLNLGFIGDIHGDFQRLQKIIKPFENTIFIIVGDCGFGFPDTKEDKIIKMLKSTFNAFLEKRNLYLLFIRGNHDNPEMFTGKLFSERFQLLPDYTLVTIDDTNILCVGGAVSVDRRFRKINTSYWYDEEMLPTKFCDFKVNILCTHAMNKEYISHLLPIMPDWLRISFDVDKKLYQDCNREFTICNDLLKYYDPEYWIHGHYHVSGTINIANTRIISLNCNELYEYKK
jgi:UDP-2,3-diacylglucosamine pyrophosphatase LpxH